MSNIAAYAPTQEEMGSTSGDFDALPAGIYQARIERVDIKDNEYFVDERGQTVLSIGFVITGPRFANRWIWNDIYFMAPDAAKKRIAWIVLDLMAKAAGLSGKDELAKDTSQLLGAEIPIEVTVYDKKNGGQGNGVKMVTSKPAAAAPKPAFGHPSKPAAPKAATAKRPF